MSPIEVDYSPDLAELLASVKRPVSFYRVRLDRDAGGKSWEKALDSVLDMAVKGSGREGAPVSSELDCESIDI